MKTTNSRAWYFVTGFVIKTAHTPDLSPLDYWFWGAMDRIIHIQKTNSIPALKRLISEAAGEISENAVRRRVHLRIRNNGANFEAEIELGKFN